MGRIPNAKYEGFRLTYGGADHLALHAHSKSGAVFAVGNVVGVGKESDILAVAPPSTHNSRGEERRGEKRGKRGSGGGEGTQRGLGDGSGNGSGDREEKDVQYALKIHRLGRISFRRIKEKRDYLGKRHSSSSWLHLSRLAALKEYTFMTALYEHGFPVPKPIAHDRHTIVMELIEGFPLRQVAEVPDPQGLYGELMEMVLRLARYGLIHGDFNEFNVLVREDAVDSGEEGGLEREVEKLALDEGKGNRSTIKLTPILIDFPQMVSMNHPDAKSYFERDVACIKRYFSRRFGFTSDEPGPFYEDALETVGRGGAKMLDIEASASGFSKKMAKELEAYLKETGGDSEPGGEAAEGGNELEDDDEGELDSELDEELEQ